MGLTASSSTFNPRHPERESGKYLSKAGHECQEKLPDSGAAGETEIVVGDAMTAF
jgi:hypothetical protein